MSTANAVVKLLETAAEEIPVGEVIETFFDWALGHTTTDALHAQLTAAGVRQAKAVKAEADRIAFGDPPTE